MSGWEWGGRGSGGGGDSRLATASDKPSADDSKETVTPETLRQLAGEWSLAGDRKLLQLLENVHQRIMVKCEHTTARLDEMTTSLDTASISLQNVNNRFAALGNTQFIESRVYDDDISAGDTGHSNTLQEKKKEDTQRSVEEDILAVSATLAQYYDEVHIAPDTDSDTDSDDMEDQVVLRPKDLYPHRPLPHIIGSAAWTNKWHAGLIEEDSDSGSSVDKREKEEDQYSSCDSYEPSNPTFDSRLNKLDKDAYSGETAVSEDSASHITDAVPSAATAGTATTLDAPHVKPSPSDFAAELARRLGGDAAPPVITQQQQQQQQRRPARPNDNRSGMFVDRAPPSHLTANVFSDEPPPIDEAIEDEEPEEQSYDDDIFADLRNTNVFNKNTSIFNKANSADTNKAKGHYGGLFDDLMSDESNRNESESQKDIFDDFADDNSNVFAKKGDVRKVDTDVRKAVKNDNVLKNDGSGLFDDDDDLFADVDVGKNVSNPTSSKPVPKTRGLFDDEEGEDDLFADQIKVNKTDVAENREVQNKQEVAQGSTGSSTKKPVGAISLFGSKQGAENIGAAILKHHQRKVSSSSDDNDESFDDSSKVETRSSTEYRNEDRSNSTDDDFDDLFAVNKNIKPVNPNAKFDDLFAKSLERNRNEEKKTDERKYITKENLLDKGTEYQSIEENKKVTQKENMVYKDDLFDVSKKSSAEQRKINENKKDDKRENTLFSDDLFDDGDIFTSTMIPKADNLIKKAEPIKDIFDDDDDLFSDIKTTKPRDSLKTKTIDLKSKSLFDDNEIEDLFANPIIKPKTDVITKPNAAEDLKKEHKETVNENKYSDKIIAREKVTTDNVTDILESPATDANKILDKDTPKSIIEVPNKPILTGEPILKNKQPFSNELNKPIINDKPILEDKQHISDKLNKPIATEKPTPKDKQHISDELNKPMITEKPILKNKQTINDELSKPMKTGKPILKDKQHISDKLNKPIATEKPTLKDKQHISDELNKPIITEKPILKDKQPIHDELSKPLKTGKPILKDKPKNVTKEENIEEQKKDNFTESTINKPTEHDSFEDVITQQSNLPNIHEKITKFPDVPKNIYEDVSKSENPGDDFFNTIFDDQPPAFQRPTEPKKSKNVNALFDDDSDDEGLFLKKHDNISVTNSDDSKSVDDFIPPSDDRLFGIFHSESPELDDVNFAIKRNDDVVKNDPQDLKISEDKHGDLFNINSNVESDKVELRKEDDKKNEPAKDSRADDFFEDLEYVKTIRNEDGQKRQEILSSTKLNIAPKHSGYSEIGTIENKEQVFKDDPKNNFVGDKNNYFSKNVNTGKLEDHSLHIDTNIDVAKTKEIFDKPGELSPTVSETSQSERKSVNKLKPINLNINVNALLPGGSPKKSNKAEIANEQDEFKPDKEEKIDLHIESISSKSDYVDSPIVSQSQIVKSISFDKGPESPTLINTFSKERAKIQVKRRPSSRKARKDAIRKSAVNLDFDSNLPRTVDMTDSFTTSLPTSPQEVVRSLESNLKVDKHFKIEREIVDSKITHTQKKQEEKKFNIDSEDSDSAGKIRTLGKVYASKNTKEILNTPESKNIDVFGEESIFHFDKDRSSVKDNNKSVKITNPTGDQIFSNPNVRDDLFASLKIKKSVDEIANENIVRESQAKNVLFDSDESEFDELFKPNTVKIKTSSKSSDRKPVTIITTKTSDEIAKPTNTVKGFITPIPTTNTTTNPTKEDSRKTKRSSLFQDDIEDDELFGGGAKKTATVQTLRETKISNIHEEKLYPDSDEDLFSKKIKTDETKKALMKKSEKKSLFGDDDSDEDIFGTTTSVKASTKRQISQPEEGPSQNVTSAEAVFKDPLSFFD